MSGKLEETRVLKVNARQKQEIKYESNAERSGSVEWWAVVVVVAETAEGLAPPSRPFRVTSPLLPQTCRFRTLASICPTANVRPAGHSSVSSTTFLVISTVDALKTFVKSSYRGYEELHIPPQLL
jgi:hypothetical protein